MSAIDQYRHMLLGFIHCPSKHDFVYNNPTREIPIYELLENIPKNEQSFDGKKGDIILGGGKGEAQAMRISIPESLYFFTTEDWNNIEDNNSLFKTFWTPTQSYILCEGFFTLGWTVTIPIEFWLAENLCSLLIHNFDKFSSFKINSIVKTQLTFSK